MREIVHPPEPLLNEIKHVTALHLGVLFGNGLLQLGQEALPSDATHTRLPMGLAPFAGSANELLG